MDRNPRADGDQGAGGQSSPPPARGASAPAETFGLLTVRRMTKDDGRSLLVYARVPGRNEAPGEAPGRVPTA